MRIKLIALLMLAACEGEPPKMAPPPIPGNAEPEVTAETASPSESAAPVSNAPATSAQHACACACGCTDGGAAVNGGPQMVAAAIPPAAPALGVVRGTIVTTPKVSASNAVVYLEDAPIQPTAKMSTTIDNHMMTFSPFVAVVPAGGKVIFHNSDPFPHNVFSPDSGGFNIGIVAQRSASSRIFKKEAAYSLLCNLHPGMLGYLVVIPSSYYAKTDAHGSYTLKDVPVGTYKITAWAPRTQPVTQSVVVKDGEISLDFELHR